MYNFFNILILFYFKFQIHMLKYILTPKMLVGDISFLTFELRNFSIIIFPFCWQIFATSKRLFYCVVVHLFIFENVLDSQLPIDYLFTVYFRYYAWLITICVVYIDYFYKWKMKFVNYVITKTNIIIQPLK